MIVKVQILRVNVSTPGTHSTLEMGIVGNHRRNQAVYKRGVITERIREGRYNHLAPLFQSREERPITRQRASPKVCLGQRSMSYRLWGRRDGAVERAAGLWAIPLADEEVD